MKENNVIVLQNEVVTISGIKLVGLNYMKADDSVYDPHQVTSETIKDILPTLDLSGNIPKIVLHHGPWGIEYMNKHGVDLVLAGHTHAGQVFPASFITNIIFPYNKGLAEYKETYMYVSQGAATFMPRMRLGTNNEINFITLEAKK
jgi:predicted MPP superfamily phosphohydrolase